MARFVVATAAAFALLLSFPTVVDALQKRRDKTVEVFTVFERQSDDGPRHSPLFTLPVGGEELEFPSKMVLFNNDLYGSEDDLINQDEAYTIGYNQGHCVETRATEGFVAECFFTYVFDDDDGGSLTANGPFNFNATLGVLPSVLAVTGGTGKYAFTQGEAAVSAGPAEDFPSLQFDFTLKNNSKSST